MTILVKLIKVAGPKMVPFLKAVTIYFLLVTFEHTGQFWSTILKCAPIVCLMAFILLYGIKLTEGFTYTHKILIGLIFSCIGDALLNLNLFPHGMGAFAIAQIFYIMAFGFKPLKLKLGLFLYVLGVLMVLLIHKNLNKILIIGLPIYTFLLLTMVWRGIARVNSKDINNITKMGCAIAAVVFAISDGFIAIDRFYTPIPYRQILIMTTYYAAQFGITLSIVNLKIEPTEVERQKLN